MYTRLMNENQMTAIQFFIEALEHKSTPSGRTEDYNEGYADVIDSILYAIRSGDVKNIRDLDELINHMDAFAEDFDGEFGVGYQDAVNYCLKHLLLPV
jgi:hypothetical protein